MLNGRIPDLVERDGKFCRNNWYGPALREKTLDNDYVCSVADYLDGGMILFSGDPRRLLIERLGFDGYGDLKSFLNLSYPKDGSKLRCYFDECGHGDSIIIKLRGPEFSKFDDCKMAHGNPKYDLFAICTMGEPDGFARGVRLQVTSLTPWRIRSNLDEKYSFTIGGVKWVDRKDLGIEAGEEGEPFEGSEITGFKQSGLSSSHTGIVPDMIGQFRREQEKQGNRAPRDPSTGARIDYSKLYSRAFRNARFHGGSMQSIDKRN
jgi:hypothetical protein